MNIVKTICGACAQNDCGMDVYVENGEIVRISGMREHPYNRGVLCPKGLASSQTVKDPMRLKYPIKRIGERGEGKWARITWDEALETIADKLLALKAEFGPETFGVFRGAGPGWGGSWVYAQRFMHAFGSPNYATQVHLCFGPRAVAMATTYGGVPEAAGAAIESLGLTLKDLADNPGGKEWRYPEEEVLKFYEKEGFNTPTRKVELFNTTFGKNHYDPLPRYHEPAESPI